MQNIANFENVSSCPAPIVDVIIQLMAADHSLDSLYAGTSIHCPNHPCPFHVSPMVVQSV